MIKLIKQFIINVMLLIFLIELAPFPIHFQEKINITNEANAFTTQLDCIAPGYVIRAEGGGITFDLRDRVDINLTVESFSVKNTNPDRAKNDLKEEMIDNNGIKWLCKDPMINGDIYEIDLNMYNSDLQKSIKYVNTFKFTDKNAVYKPHIEITPLETNQFNHCRIQDVIIDFRDCKEIINKSKSLKLEILNSDLTKIDLDTITVDKDKLIKDNYRITIPYLSSAFDVNKDYIIRLYADKQFWDRLFSAVLKGNPRVITTFTPNEDPLMYYNGKIEFLSSTLDFSRSMINDTTAKLILRNNKKGLKSVEATGKITDSLFLTVPDEYFGFKEPTDVVYILTDNHTGRILYQQLTQITFNKKDKRPHMWTGLKIFPSVDSGGYKIDYLYPFSNDSDRIPHSWDGFPKAHYITLFDYTLKNQIGGEFRFDVIKSKLEFLDVKHDVRGANFRIPFKDMKQGFNTYNFKVESSNSYKDWAYAYVPFGIYSDILELKMLDSDIKDLIPSNSGNGYDFTLVIKNQNVVVGEIMSIIDDNGKEYTAKANASKEFKFSNVPLIFGGKYIVTYNNISGLLYFKSVDSSILFNPIIVGTAVDGQETLDVTFNKRYESILNADNSKNNLKILHMNGNSTGNEFSNFGIGTTNFKIKNSLNNGEYYIAEFTNSNGETYKTTFEYTTLRLSLGSTTGTSVKLNWEYPNNYLIMDGDTLNIYFKKDGFNYPPVADAKIMHGFQGIDFNEIRTYTINSLSPNMNYKAKLELITNEGTKFSSETEFVTSDFKIQNEHIEGLTENGIVNDKNINFLWDINQGDIEFSKGDKIDVFLKLKSHDAFPKTPQKTITEDINRVRKVVFEAPNYYEPYSVKIVYTIGGTRHSSKVIDFIVEPQNIDVSFDEITDSSASMKWTYPENIEIVDNQELNIYLKKSSDVEYQKIRTIKQSETPLKDFTSHSFENLQSDSIYQVKIEYKVGEKTVAGVKEDIKQVRDLEFKTKRFTIDKFSVERIDATKIKIKWNVSNKNYKYSNGDHINVFVKEKSQSAYPTSSSFSANQDLNNVNSCELVIPKYEVGYDIKVSYMLKGKEFVGYTSYKINIEKININIDSIQDNNVKISWSYPKNYFFKNGDKIELKLEELSEEQQTTEPKEGQQTTPINQNESKVHSDSENLSNFTTKEFTLNQGKRYVFKFIFTPVDLPSREDIYKFKAVSGFQILNVDSMSKNSTSVKLNWEFYPKEYQFKSGDKVDILYKEIGAEKQETQFDSVSPVITKSEGLNDFKSSVVKGLQVDKEYLFRVRYTIAENQNVIFEDVKGKPEFGKFEGNVIDTQPTGVKLELTYPENYEKVNGDILDVFVKPRDATSYDTNPNFSVVHGPEENNVNLNEVSLLDILGLSPSTDYDTKIVFWSDGGKGSKHEKQLTFSTNSIQGISEVIVGDIMDYVVKIGVKMDPEDIVLSNRDSCKVFIKKKDQQEYPINPNGEVRGDIFNGDKVVVAYFEELNAEYDVKVVVDIDGVLFENTTSFSSKVDDLIVDIKEVHPMTAQVEWKYPSNYTLVDGESIRVFTKYKTDGEFLEKPDLELVQSEELNLSQVTLIEIYELIPDTEYDVKVELKLLETNVEPVLKEFKTQAFEVENLKVRDTNSKGMAISWDLNTQELNFLDSYDSLAVFVKDSRKDEYNFSEPVVEFTKGLDSIRSASFPIDSSMKNMDILVSYLVEDYEAFAELSYKPLRVHAKTEDEGVLIKWEYPDDIKFVDEDRVDIYLKYSDNSGYKKNPDFRYVNGVDGDLSNLNEVFFKGLKPGEYIMKFSLITSEMVYNPIEIEFSTQRDVNEDAIFLKFDGKSKNRQIYLSMEEDIPIDYDQGYYIYPEGLEIEVDFDKNRLIVNNLVPGKEYENIVITFVKDDGSEVNFVTENVQIEPETLLEEFLTNIYKFAFERYPDEGGYSYWLAKLLERTDITGKYVLYNLMFAEREFSDRNLPDDELIKVLYQIVVNRDYDEQGLNFWINEYKNKYLPEANGDSYEAQKAIVTRMLYEQEFRNLCEKMGILW